MKTTYVTSGTCARFIDIEIDGDRIKTINFIGGCPGNTKGLARLLPGLSIEEVIAKLKGIACRGTTSCPDQLATALEQLALRQAS